MHTRVDQISDRIYRISTCIPEVAPGGFTVNQFLVDAEEPLLYHTGMRQLFPLVKEAIERVMPVERLRWISFAHVEADECGAVNEFLAVAPHAQVAHGELGCLVSLNDLCDRSPRPRTCARACAPRSRPSRSTPASSAASCPSNSPTSPMPRTRR